MSKRTANPVSRQHTTNNTMKSKTKQNHPLGTCGTDTNKTTLYMVNLHSTVYYEMSLPVAAKSGEEAKNIAEKIARGMNDDHWQMVDHDMFAFEASEVTEGGRHV